MIKRYEVNETGETYLRIWQKLTFGKEILPIDFFKENRLKDFSGCIRLKVFQYDQNTRLFYINQCLYWVTTEESIYNYLDTGRGITYYSYGSYRSKNEKFIIYMYNDLLITDNKITDFEEYRDKESMNLKVLLETDNEKVYLIYEEDLKAIEKRFAELKAEEELIKKAEKEEELKNVEEVERRMSLLKQYDKMTLLEDEKGIIKDNYFIDKHRGIKVEFTDKIIKLFTKGELINESRYDTNFIRLNYYDFFYKLERIFDVGKYETPIEEKLKEVNPKWLHFKIYNYDPETKTETFLKEVKFEHIIKEGKSKFKINGVVMPRQKIQKAFRFIGGDYHISNVIKERIINFESYLEKIRIYSGTQLELLGGKTVEIRVNHIKIPLSFSFVAEDKNNWEIIFEDFKLKKSYSEVKEAFRYISGGGISAIASICENLHSGSKLEDILINKVKSYLEKRELAEQRAEKLFNEFLEKNKTRVFKKEGGYIVKGKLKNYLVKMKNAEDVGVYSYPSMEYICINEKTQEGQYLCKYDKFLQFVICMLNDGNLRQEIHTLH